METLFYVIIVATGAAGSVVAWYMMEKARAEDIINIEDENSLDER